MLQRTPHITNLSIFFSFPESKLSAVSYSTTVILFSVKVPVLSLQITVALPSVSTAGSCFTRAFFLAILSTPKAITTVTVAGNPSGITDIARDIEIIKISIKF